MVVGQGEVWWADLGEPVGSAPDWRRPVLVVQCDAFNRSRVATTLCVALTSNLNWAAAPGNVVLRAQETGLDRDSVANVSQMLTLDKTQLIELAGRIPQRNLGLVMAGIDVVLGR